VPEQNPTEKGAERGGAEQIEVVMPKCPHCGKDLPGMNVSTMMLPTPQDPRGDMTFLMPCCPFPECGKVIAAQFIGHTPRQAGVAMPPKGLWSPS
jgi:hypothetical protein